MSGGGPFQPGTAAAIGSEFLELFTRTPFADVKRALLEGDDFASVNAVLGEFGRFLDRVIDPEIVVDFREASSVAPDQDLIREGRQGWVDLWRVFMTPWRDFSVSDQHFHPLDDSRLIVDAIWNLTGEESGVPLAMLSVGLWKVRDGRVVRIAQYDSVAKAQEAARLPEWQPPGQVFNQHRARAGDTESMSTDPVDIVRDLNRTLDGIDHVSFRDEVERTESLDDLRGGPFEWIADKVEALVSPDCRVEWVGLTTPMVEGSEFSNRDEWMGLWRQWLAAWDEYELEDSNYEAFGDQVIVDIVHRGRGRGSGIELELPQTQLWTVRDGVLRHLRVFERREPAVEVARTELEAGER